MDDVAMFDETMNDDSKSQGDPQSPVRQRLVGKASLVRTLDKHHNEPRHTSRDKSRDRSPLNDVETPSSKKTKQSSRSWSLLNFMSPFEGRSKHDQRVTEDVLAQNSELQQQTDDLQAEIETLKQKCFLLQAQCDSTRDRSRENKALQEQVHALQSGKDALERALNSSKADYESLRATLSEERSKTAALVKKTQSLRSLLIPANEIQLSDSEVIHKFTSMRSQILKLVKTTWRRDRFDTSRRPTDLHKKALRPFLAGEVDMKYLDNVLRRVIFVMLNNHILSVRTYALENAEFDQTLHKVEAHMREMLPEDRLVSLVDWRMATMKATEDFSKDKYRLARTAHSEIWSYFEIFKTSSEKSAVEGKQMLEKICKDAVNLSLMMRKAKDEYFVTILPEAEEEPISEFEDCVEEEASHPAGSCDPETVAYIITGALAKFPKGNKNPMVLEKAQAVVYR